MKDYTKTLAFPPRNPDLNSDPLTVGEIQNPPLTRYSYNSPVSLPISSFPPLFSHLPNLLNPPPSFPLSLSNILNPPPRLPFPLSPMSPPMPSNLPPLPITQNLPPIPVKPPLLHDGLFPQILFFRFIDDAPGRIGVHLFVGFGGRCLRAR